MRIKRLAIILFAVILFNCCFAQVDSLRLYYKNIQAAELCITDSNYIQAAKFFDTAFTLKTHPFSSDLYNAMTVSVLLKAYPKTAGYLERLFQLGYTLKYINSLKNYREFFASAYGRAAIKKSKVIKRVYNIKYRAAIDKLVYDDQLFRLKEHHYELYADTIRKIDNKNVILFLGLIKKYGFPSEQKIGIDTNGVSSPPYKVLIIHQNNGANYQSYNYGNIIRAAVLKGELKNIVGAEFIEGNDGIKYYDTYGLVNAKYDTTITVIDNNGILIKKDTTFQTPWGYFEPNSAAIEKYNHSRKEIFLEPWQDYLKKIVYVVKRKPLLFNLSGGHNTTFYCSTYKDYLHIEKNLIYP